MTPRPDHSVGSRVGERPTPDEGSSVWVLSYDYGSEGVGEVLRAYTDEARARDILALLQAHSYVTYALTEVLLIRSGTLAGGAPTRQDGSPVSNGTTKKEAPEGDPQ